MRHLLGFSWLFLFGKTPGNSTKFWEALTIASVASWEALGNPCIDSKCPEGHTWHDKTNHTATTCVTSRPSFPMAYPDDTWKHIWFCSSWPTLDTIQNSHRYSHYVSMLIVGYEAIHPSFATGRKTCCVIPKLIAASIPCVYPSSMGISGS